VSPVSLLVNRQHRAQGALRQSYFCAKSHLVIWPGWVRIRSPEKPPSQARYLSYKLGQTQRGHTKGDSASPASWLPYPLFSTTTHSLLVVSLQKHDHWHLISPTWHF
jgi:hypothetical protein